MSQWIRRVHACTRWLHKQDLRGFRKLAYHLPRLLFPKPSGPIIWPNTYGFKLHIDPSTDTGVEHSLYYEGAYEPGTLKIIELLLQPGDHFVDVGANIGLMSIFAARRVGLNGKVTAFEPHPNTREILIKNIALNGLERTVQVMPYALGAQRGTAQLYDDPSKNRGAASLMKTGSTAVVHEVQTMSLDNFLKKPRFVNFPLPSLIKIDVEGLELDVLKGAMSLLGSTSPPALIIESSANRDHSEATDTAALYNFISNIQGYQIYKGLKNKSFTSRLIKVNHADEMPNHDNIYALQKIHMARFPN